MSYFTTNESLAQRRRKPEVAVRNYHSRCKAELLKRGPNGGSLLDLGAGRGADASRYNQFCRVLAVDQDADALKELSRRTGNATQVKTTCADFCRPLEIQEHFDITAAFFCCHYAFRNLAAFAENVARSLVSGGLFVGIDLDGTRVLEMLRVERQKTFGGKWARMELLDDDRNIAVTIESISDQPKTESLVFWQVFRRAMQHQGLVLLDTGILEPGQSISDESLANFSRLHRWWVFKKF